MELKEQRPPPPAQLPVFEGRVALQGAVSGAGEGGLQCAWGNHFSAMFLSHFRGLWSESLWLSEPPGGNVFK